VVKNIVKYKLQIICISITKAIEKKSGKLFFLANLRGITSKVVKSEVELGRPL
jgi:hypothetical protein